MEFMKLKNLLKIAFAMLVLSITKIWSRTLPTSSIQAIVLLYPDANPDFASTLQLNGDNDAEEHGQRQKREAYDPYSAYYFYPKSINPSPSSNDRYNAEASSYVNRRETHESNQIGAQNGNKYKYKPLFQYKSTQSRRRKLFVPNLFG